MKVLRLTGSFLILLISVPTFAQSPQNQTPEARQTEIKKKIFELQLKNATRNSQQKLLSGAPLQIPKTNILSPLTALQATVKGTFWRNPAWVETLALSADQQSKMDEVFQQYRLKLIDLTASLQKEELILEPLLGSTRPAPEVEKIMTQIDRIADARAELEKANSKMLVSILEVLNADQWSKLPLQGKPGVFLKKSSAIR
jgi:hypothetical protein